MRPFSKPTLRDFWTLHPQSQGWLEQWWLRARTADWRTFADVRRDYPSVDLVRTASGDKLVFNVAGNKYRLVVLAKFGNESLYILWIGTHAEYDRLDIERL